MDLGERVRRLRRGLSMMSDDLARSQVDDQVSSVDSGKEHAMPRRETEGTRLTPGCFAGIVVTVVVGLLILPVLFGFTSVQSYEGCLLVRNGKIKEEWEPGLHWRYPIMSNVTCYRTA